MAQSRGYKRTMNFIYGMGAAVVIVGALFKIQHMSLGPITGGMMLTIGLLVEAAVFAVSAFDPPEEDLDWALVYPELASGKGRAKSKEIKQVQDAENMLSQKLDNMLKEAKLDAGMMTSLSTSIQNFSGAAQNIQPAVDSIAATSKYSEQMTMAAAQMESLNSLYKVQLESAGRQAEINESVVENAGKLKEQMASMAANLSSLNGVYGGMLTAMSTKN